MFKKIFQVLVFLSLLGSNLSGLPVIVQGQEPTDVEANQEIADYLMKIGDTILEFDDQADKPTEEEIIQMLDFAMKAQSGRNTQAYWVTVITDDEVQANELALSPEFKPAKSTVTFVYAYPEGEDPSLVDIGLSMGYLCVMAEVLGYGAHIYFEPSRYWADSGNYVDYLPEGYQPIGFILVGLPNQADVTSSATAGDREAKYNFYEAGQSPQSSGQEVDGESSEDAVSGATEEAEESQN